MVKTANAPPLNSRPILISVVLPDITFRRVIEKKIFSKFCVGNPEHENKINL
jgi:hypothetical protein